MSSHERALSIVVVGLGEAGGRIAAEFHRRGYRALALNTSAAELDALGNGTGPSLPEDRRILVSDGGRSTGGDPLRGDAALRANAAKIRETVRTHGSGASGLLLVGGLGGGTGSALAALVSVLEGGDFPPIAVMATLPTAGASAVTKVHAARGAHALTKCDLAGLVVIDNARGVDLNADLPLLEYHTHVNELVVEPFDDFNCLPGRRDLTAIRAFDASALQNLVFSGGAITYAKRELDVCTADAITDGVMDALYGSWLIAAGIEPTSVTALAMVVEAPDSVLAELPVRAVEGLLEHWKTDTEGACVDVGIYRRSGKDDGRTVLHVMASASDLPVRLGELVNEAARESRAASAKKKKLPTLDVGALDGATVPKLHAPEDAITGRYHEVADDEDHPRTKSTPPQGQPKEPKKADESGPRPLPSLRPPSDFRDSRANIDMEALRKIPGQAAYARIVTRYQNTTDASVRDAIRHRLEQDRLSPHAQVRYHAVDAMVKLGPIAFQEALIAASEDEDPAVRHIADKALTETRRLSMRVL